MMQNEREKEKGKEECVKEKMINVDFWRWLLIFYFSETSIYKQLNSNNQIERDENTKKWKLTWQLNHSTISFVMNTISWEVGTLMLTVPSHQDMYFYLSDEIISCFILFKSKENSPDKSQQQPSTARRIWFEDMIILNIISKMEYIKSLNCYW